MSLLKKIITLGILNADELSTSVEQEFGSYNEMFELLFGHTSYSFKFYQVTNNVFPQRIDECDAYLITGSKFSAYDNYEWIIKLKEFINHIIQSDKKLIGICFGHQVIAEALAGKVSKNTNGWGLGVMHCDIVHYRSWMEPNIPSYALLVIKVRLKNCQKMRFSLRVMSFV